VRVLDLFHGHLQEVADKSAIRDLISVPINSRVLVMVQTGFIFEVLNRCFNVVKELINGMVGAVSDHKVEARGLLGLGDGPVVLGVQVVSHGDGVVLVTRAGAGHGHVVGKQLDLGEGGHVFPQLLDAVEDCLRFLRVSKLY
jgi:hypothetical protein